MPESALYDQDYDAWANEQAALLRAGNLAAADIENIAEEIESLGKSEKRELVSRFIVLLKHLLQWQFQPKRRSTSWEVAVTVQRNALARHFEDNPSRVPVANKAITAAYLDARLEASAETKLSRKSFPATCPWTLAQIADENLWPA